MEYLKVRSCMICFTIIKDEPIGSPQKDLVVELLKVDFDDKKNVICNVCSAKLYAAQKFKMTCLHTENVIDHYAGEATVLPPLGIKEIYMKENTSEHVLDDLKICRLCLQPIKSISEFKAINAEQVDMIQKLVPKMNVFIIEEPVMCKDCQDSLDVHCNFLKKYWDVEQNVENVSYRQVSNASSSESTVNVSVKMEDVDIEFDDVPELIKTEYVDIKCEDIKSESEIHGYQITSKEISDDKNGETTQYSTFVDEHKIHMYKCERYTTHGTKYEAALNDNMIIQEGPSTLDSPSEVQMYKCEICNYETKYNSHIKRHMIVHKDSLYVCKTCNYETRRKWNLKNHLLIHKDPSEVERYKCKACSYETRRKGNLKIHHTLVHKDPSEVQMYKCETCNYASKQRSKLRCHMLIHKDPSQVQMYKCETCSFETMRKRNLNAHILTHKDPSEVQMYKCETCNYASKRRSKLRSHALIHKDPSELQMYKCADCNYETKFKNHLKRHSLVHKDPSEVPMYKCQICNYESKYNGDLKVHMLIHKTPSEVQMYKCENCNYVTKLKGKLKSHMVIHKSSSEIQMYKCRSCNYETKYNINLKRHMLVHQRSAI